MSQRQCDKCGETVDEARAFCPGCGYALVAERKRKTTSEFESGEHTIQMGNTMYNQMLSDMGLNISKEYRAAETTVESVITPPTPAPARSRSYIKWIIIGAIVLFFLALIVVFVAGFIVYWLSGPA